MACLILTSCTTGNTTVLSTQPVVSPGLIPYIGQHVSIIGYPGVCFSVEQTENTCLDCEKNPSLLPIAGNPVCQCTIPFLAYILTPCEGSGLPTLYTTQNLYIYVGTSITFFGQNGACYSVVGSLIIPQGLNPVIVDCPIACECTPVVCGCPDGYVINDEGLCEGILTVPPIVNPTTYVVAQALFFTGQFSIEPAQFFEDITNKPWPILSNAGPCVVNPLLSCSKYTDNNLVPLIVTNTLSNSIWGGPGSPLNFRMAIAGVWTNSFNYDPIDEWIGFSYCVTLTETKTYYIAYAVDDFARILVDGVIMLQQDTSGWAFRSMQIFPLTLQAGIHTITGEVKNAGSSAIFAFEIYDATLSQLLAVANPGDIDPYIVFSSGDQIGLNWQTGETSGYTCPDGYALNTCDGLTCTQIVTVPQVPCFAWEITFCEGTGLDPIITSTDLTQYIGGVYEITYTIPGPTVVTACGTVAQAPAQTAPSFTGTFSQIIYDCCESCMATCYLLEDCQNAVPDMILCTDLKDYVGKVIKIKGCGNICWTVSEAASCVGSINFEGEVTEFDTCLECLPPVPVPVPLELNLRKVKPGYNSPNSCVTLEYLQRVNCNFALQVYNEMLIKRYGITVCCDQDVDTWDIQKSELDYMLMGDPSLCKSTLCDCKAPCLIDVIFALVPTCVSPVIYSTIFSLDCGDPVLVSAEIEAPVIYDCLCYPVRLTVSPTTVSYYNCCCEYVSEVMTSSGNICAITTPTSLTNPINIGTVVECGSEDCGVPACNCYTVTADVGQNAQVDYINCDGSPIQLRSLPGTYSFCAIAPPTVTNATFVDNGPCISNQSCANVNDDCTCYNINITNGTGTFAYVNCSNVIQLSVIVGTGRVCAKTVPILLTPSGVQSTINIPSGVFCSGNECLPIP